MTSVSSYDATETELMTAVNIDNNPYVITL